MRKLLLLLFLSAWLLPVQAVDITVDNIKRNYLVYVPKNLGSKRPLLISCHGMNQDAAYQKGMLAIESVADTAKFVTVFPNGIDKGWDISGDRDINFVKALIEEMVTKYDIDPNRVYLSGFSMGGMFTYHAMNKIADKIAAFAPISGYPMGGTTANASVRPIPIIHTHGTSDDVVAFSGVQGALNAWIKHNNCPTTDKVTKNYRNASHITRHVWGPGNNGVEVVLMEMANKGHWISNDNGVKTGDEIWRFCKRYSLVLKDPFVSITAPSNGLTYITFGGASEVPPITVKATAKDPDGTVASVSFYDGKTLLTTLEKAPYTCQLDSLKKGTHTIRVVATDDEGNTGSNEITINVLEPTGSYVFSKTFSTENSVPDGWTTYDGKEKRTGFSSGYSLGSRVFHFTGSQHDFEWGLYTRNVTGEANAGYARFADKGTSTSLTLYPGNYRIYYHVVNWNQPDFSPIRVVVETLDGKAVYTENFTPVANVGNSASSSFSGSKAMNFTFDVTEKNRYVVTFYTDDAEWADLVVGASSISRKGDVSAVEGVKEQAPSRTYYYNMSGQRIQPDNHHGPLIEQTVMDNGRSVSRKIMK